MEAEEPCRLRVLEHEQLGSGAFSTVYRGILDAKRCVAVKRLHFRDDGDYSEEAAILSRLKHRNIIGYYGTSENGEGTHDLVLDLAYSVTLAGAIDRGNLEPKWKRSTIHQIASGVAYLHTRGVMHLDLKPENILFSDYLLNRVLICDFGSALREKDTLVAGALKFRAPEERYTQKSDVFSLASMACCIFVERNPESAEHTANLVDYLLKNFHLYCKNDAWRLAIAQGVERLPDLRLTARQFRDAFEGRRSGLNRVFSEVISALTSVSSYTTDP